MINIVEFLNTPTELQQIEVPSTKKLIQSFKARSDTKRTNSEIFADWLTQKFGSIAFLSANILWFTIWIVINTGLVPGMVPFDPFPFGFLTMVVSLEAIFLAIIVLISQNRSAKVDDLRQEIGLKVNIISEKEITKLLQIMVMHIEKNGMDLSHDKDLNKMIQQTNIDKIEQRIQKEII